MDGSLWNFEGMSGINYQWFKFGHDPAGILDSGSLWNFRYHCVKGGIREPLAKPRWWRHLANSFALAEVPAGYDCLSSWLCYFCVLSFDAKHTWTESRNFPTYSCKLSTKNNIMTAHNFSFTAKFLPLGIFSPKFCIFEQKNKSLNLGKCRCDAPSLVSMYCK